MQRIIYYVAISLDGYIAGPGGDISQFAMQGEGVTKYQTDLADFSTVIMGRKTYEFGYQFGLTPGQPAYPHMQHHIFSSSLSFSEASDQVQVEELSINRIEGIRDQSPTDVYLCGGGDFAGWMLENDLIDQLKIKLNPIVLGGGTKLFGESSFKANFRLVQRETFSDNSLELLTYDVKI